MKYCKDCKYFEMDVMDQENLSRCAHPSLIINSQSLVTSEKYDSWLAIDGSHQDFKPFCSSVRLGSITYKCGPDALLFETSRALLEKWKQELKRDQEIEARQERKRDRAKEREDYDFERDSGARP